MQLPWAQRETVEGQYTYTRSGWRIPQLDMRSVYKSPLEESAALQRIRNQALLASMQANQKTSPVQMPASNSLYNCVGMIFCSRRAFVNIAHIYDILKHDGYNLVKQESLAPGDLVLYTQNEEPVHIGMVSSVSSVDLRVLSKWGKDGEMVHDYREVPAHCGTPTAYYSTRVSHAAR